MTRSITLFILLLWAPGLRAQTLQVETISTEHGLSQGFVPAICQDEDGFLWFATKNGLNRYDGCGTRAMGIDPSRTVAAGHAVLAHEIPLEGVIRSGFPDQSGNVWIGTDAKGIRKFTPRKEGFRNYLPGVSVFCRPIYDGNRYVLMGDLRHEAFTSQILDLANGQAQHLKDFGIRPDFMVRGAALAEDGTFWLFPTIQGRNTLIRLDPSTGRKAGFEAPLIAQARLVHHAHRARQRRGMDVWYMAVCPL